MYLYLYKSLLDFFKFNYECKQDSLDKCKEWDATLENIRTF